jgi:hypothetical protein
MRSSPESLLTLDERIQQRSEFGESGNDEHLILEVEQASEVMCTSALAQRAARG